MKIDFIEIFASFMVLFAIIDILGSVPIILDLKAKTGDIKPAKITLIAFIIMLCFLFVGEPLLGIFGVDISSFAIAGSVVVFLIGIEMILGRELFKLSSSDKGGAIVPLAFPLIAGAGAITTIISLEAEYEIINIFIALILNMVFVYFVLKLTGWFGKVLGPSGLDIIKKFFGVILLAIAIRLFLSNTGIIINK